jgi:hypothetical protein
MSQCDLKILLESLSFKQALKYLLIKERYRHELDIQAINIDLNKLNDVELPELPMDLWIDV